MRKVFFFCLAGALLVAVSAMAQNKVVVIPMGSSGKGTDGQVQYNDEGKTAGAEVYYDKATGKLQLPGELRTVDGAGNNRLWGKGRPQNGLLNHTDPDGYCTTSAGIKHALSSRIDTWGNADDLCPQGTWVCSNDDLPTSGSCEIVPINTFSYATCGGAAAPSATQTMLNGWVSDSSLASFSEEEGIATAPLRRSNGWGSLSIGVTCSMFRAWCCWE